MIQIKTLQYDDEYDFKLGIRFNNDICSSYLEIYAQTGIFTDFAKKLIAFPFGNSKTINFEYGEDDNRWAYYLLITVDVYEPSGKSVIKILVDNKGDLINHYRCEFPIITNISTINKFGSQLLDWKPIENQTWIFPEQL